MKRLTYETAHCEGCATGAGWQGYGDCRGVERGIGDTEIRALFAERDRLRAENERLRDIGITLEQTQRERDALRDEVRPLRIIAERRAELHADRDAYRDALRELFRPPNENESRVVLYVPRKAADAARALLAKEGP